MNSGVSDDTGDLDLSALRESVRRASDRPANGQTEASNVDSRRDGPGDEHASSTDDDRVVQSPATPTDRGVLDARSEAARIREEAREQGAMIISEMREQAQYESSRIVEHGKAQIQAEFRRVSDAERSRIRQGDSAKLVVTGLMGDDGPSADLVGVAEDARALAALLTSRTLSPPVAIGLYGPWGSGKTFFMRQVESNVAELTESDALGQEFCSNVAHVWFNAWHYAEGNLWASLVDQIFSVLGERPSHYRGRVQGAIEKLAGAEEITNAARARVEDAEARVGVADAAVAEARLRRDDAVARASKLRATDLWATIELTSDEQGLESKVGEAARELGIPFLASTTRQLWTTTRSVAEAARRARVLAGTGGFKSPLAFACYALVAVAVASVVLASVLRSSSAWAGTATLIVGQAAAIAASATTFIRNYLDSAERLLAPAEALQRSLEVRADEARSALAGELAELERCAANAEIELRDANRALLDARANEAVARTEQQSLTGTRLLRAYLKERADSTDYRSYLGVVALAQRDLSDLAELMQAASEDRENDLDRIILYVDDLDRCDPQTVADVLEAIHLLLAFPLFVVMVGVSPHWLEQALQHRHAVLLSASAPTSDHTSTATAADYLEKVFQLTYTLRPLNEVQAGALLLGMAADMQTKITQAGESAQTPPQPEEPVTRAGNGPSRSARELASALALQQRELVQLEVVASLVSSSPRRAQRFLNLYLVLRARFSASDEDNHALVLAAALAVGLPKALQRYLEQPWGQDASQSAEQDVFARLDHELVQDAAEFQRLNAFKGVRGMLDKTLKHQDLLVWLDRMWSYLPLGFQPKVPGVE